MNTGQPPEKPTVELEKPPAWAIALTEKVAKGFASVEARLDTVEANQELTREQVSDIGRRQTTLEERVSRGEERQASASLRVRGESDVNLKQDAAIAQVIVKQDETVAKVDAISTKVDALAAKPDTAAVVLEEVRSLAKTPAAQKLIAAAVPVILLGLAVLGAKLQASVSKLEEKPQTVQPAPTVYLPIPVVDGGAR